MTKRLIALLLAAGLMLGAGCAKNGNDGKLPGGHSSKTDAKAGKWEEAKEPPFTAETHFAAGQLAEAQGAPMKAVEQYQAALKISPTHLQAMFRLGVVLAQVKNYPEAIATWQRYIKASNNDPTGYSNLGFCYELAGNTADAETSYRLGIAKDPKNNPCRVKYGLMLARGGRTAEALQQLQTVLSPAQAHYNVASVYEQQGRKTQAKLEYQKALELEPELTEAKVRLAELQ